MEPPRKISFAPTRSPSAGRVSTSLVSRLPLSGAGFSDAIAALNPTVHRDTIAAPLVEKLAGPFRESLDRHPWAVPPTLSGFLASTGIETSGFGFKAHPHPVHKIIETHLLHDVWPHYATVPSAVMFMKPSKFARLQRDHPNFVALHNYRLVPKDTTRYPESSGSLPAQETVFMHDTLMYFEPEQIVDLFLRCPNLEKLYASLVVPPESDFTHLSLNPDLYRFRFDGDKLIYELEQNAAHNYTQPRAALDWLKVTTIVAPQVTITVSRLDSWGPVHSLLLQRGEPPLHARTDTVSFSGPPAIELPAPASLHQDLRHRLVPKKVYDELFVYVRAVRTLRVTDPAGFVRTQCSKPEYTWVTSSAWDNLQHFCLQTAAVRSNATHPMFMSCYARLAHWVKNHAFALSSVFLPVASFAAYASTRKLVRFFHSHIDELVLFHRRLYGSPPLRAHLSIWKERLPFFRLATHPMCTGWTLFKGTRFEVPVLRQTCATLGSHPILARVLPHRPVSWVWVATAAGLAVIPVAAWALRWFLGPDSPQALHDRYHATFHPDPWTLHFRRAPAFVSRRPFLDLALEAESGPPPSPSSGDGQFRMHVSPCPPPPPNSPQTGPPSPLPVADVQVEAGPAVALDASSAPSTVVPAAPFAQRTEPGPPAASASALPPAPSSSPAQPTEQAPPAVSASTPPATAAEAASSPFLGPNAEELAASTLVVEDRGGVHQTHPPKPTPDQLLRTALEADASALGPILPYEELHPAAYTQAGATFLARDRISARANLPYPTGVDCLLRAVEAATAIDTHAQWDALCANLPDSMLNLDEIKRFGLSTDHFIVLARIFSLQATFHSEHGSVALGLRNATSNFAIDHTPGSPGHFELRLGPSGLPPAQLHGARCSDLVSALSRYNCPDGTIIPYREVHSYTTIPARAKNLVSNMKNGFDGVMANIDPQHPGTAREKILSLDGVLDIAVPRSVVLIHVAGFAGCGKSWPVAGLLKTSAFRNYKVAVPTVELRAEWKDLLQARASEKWRVGTWESSLLKSARVLVIDEVYKMPRGYLDLALHADCALEFVIVLGDPLQGEYHSSSPQSSNHRLTSEIHHLRPYIDFYCFWTRRLPKKVADCFGLKTLNDKTGFVRYSQEFPPRCKILCNSQSSMKTLQQCGYDAITIASSQGATYRETAAIHLDRNSRMLSHQHSLVAVTRSTVGITFTGDRSLLDGTSSANFIFSQVASGRPVSIPGVFSAVLPHCPFLLEPLRKRRPPSLRGAGSHVGRRIDNKSPFSPFRKIGPDYRGDVILDLSAPWLGFGESNAPQVSTHFLPETRRPLHLDLASALAEPADRPQSTKPTAASIEPVYPGETFENLAAHFLPAHDPETKEIFYRGTMSKQFPHLNMPFELSAQPSSLLAAIHSSKQDRTLLPASISKRLRFRESSRPYVITAKDELLGSLLFESLCRAYHRPPTRTYPFDERLFIECIALNEFAQLSSKTQAVIMANASRSDPDWRWCAVRIFSKAQHKVNEGSIFGNWKACQTLALMHDAVVLCLGPVKKYQRVFDQLERPPHLYVHAGNTPFQMSEWCQQFLTPGIHLANDYTAFDQSQHGEAVVLERKKMERLNIPKHLIDLHVFLKTNVETQFGPLTCMRLTGEPGTYDDNTDYNLAIIHLEYEVGRTPLMVSGDDSLLDREPPVRPQWVVLAPLLAIRFKKERSRYATFCGYYVGSAGAVRSPVALFAKLMIAVDDRSISDKLTAYLTEFSVGHSLGDAFWTLLPVELVKFQSACFDFFCRHASAELKLALKIGEVPTSILSKAFQHIKWASHAVYALLSVQHRRQILHSNRQSRSLPDDPEVSQLQGELLHNFQSSITSASSDSMLTLPLRGAGLTFSPPPAPMSTPDAKVGPPPATDDRVDRQPALPRAPALLETAAPSIDFPFQWLAGDYAGDKDAYVTQDLSSSTTLAAVTKFWRHAELLDLRAEIVPYAASFSKPITVRMVWTIGSITPPTKDELAFFGGRQITVGGPVLMNSTTHVPADLRSLNPILKSSVTLLDCPRLTYDVFSNSGTAGNHLCSVIIRGTVRLSGPTGNTISI
nr:polyprotein [Triticum aestivum marafivirus]